MQEWRLHEIETTLRWSVKGPVTHEEIQVVTVTWRDKIRIREQQRRAQQQTKAKMCSCESWSHMVFVTVSHLFKVQHWDNRCGELAMFAKIQEWEQ